MLGPAGVEDEADHMTAGNDFQAREGEHIGVTHPRLPGHSWESDKQSLTIWRQAKSDEPFNVPVDEALRLDGWEVDTKRGEFGIAVILPSWSDGSVVFQLRYFRRFIRGMHPHAVNAQRHKQLN